MSISLSRSQNVIGRGKRWILISYPWLLPMILQSSEFPHPFPLNIKQCREMSHPQGQRNQSIPLFSQHIALVSPGSYPRGKQPSQWANRDGVGDLHIDCKQSLRMVTRARKSSKASESWGEVEEEAGKEGGSLFFPPLSSFPLGQFALSSPAKLRLDWLKRDCSQSNLHTDKNNYGHNSKLFIVFSGIPYILLT